MFLIKKVVLVILLLVSFVNLYAFEQTLLPQDNITIGDKVVLNIKADGLTVDSIDKSKLQDMNFGDFELLYVNPAQDASIDFILSTYKVGKVELLSVELFYTYNDQQKFIKTNALPIEVKSLMDPKNPSQDIQDIKDIVINSHGIVWYLKIIALVLAILLIILLLVKLFLSRKKKTTAEEEKILSIPPKEYALSQFEQLQSSDLIEKGYIKEYYDKLSDIIRFYISRVYNIDAMEKTTTELYSMLKNKIAFEHNTELKKYLLNCDFVKFAKLIPTQEDIKKDFDTAKGFIDKI